MHIFYIKKRLQIINDLNSMKQKDTVTKMVLLGESTMFTSDEDSKWQGYNIVQIEQW